MLLSLKVYKILLDECKYYDIFLPNALSYNQQPPLLGIAPVYCFYKTEIFKSPSKILHILIQAIRRRQYLPKLLLLIRAVLLISPAYLGAALFPGGAYQKTVFLLKCDRECYKVILQKRQDTYHHPTTLKNRNEST